MSEITEVDPHDDSALRDWYTALHEGAVAGRTAPLVATYDAITFPLRHPGENQRAVAVAAMEDDQTVGALLLELPLRENRDTAVVEIGVPVQHRRRGVATALWAWAEVNAEEAERSVFQTEINVPAGQRTDTWPGALFASRLGFASENVEDHFVVPLPYDATTLAALERSVANPAGYRFLSWAGRCPEEHLSSYADLQTQMSRDVPVGGMTREAVVLDIERVRTADQRLAENYLSLVVLATTVGGEPAGYTQIFVQKEDPENVMQDDTLVLSAHRGNNLGTLLKATNLDQLERHHSGGRWLHTWTAETNTAMQRVNERFGFRGVEKLHEYEKSLARERG